MSSTPLFRYEQIAADLREQIRHGKIPDGARLPAERVLMAGYKVQRNTVRQALTLLSQEGWLNVRPRSGAFAVSAPAATDVTNPPSTNAADSPASFAAPAKDSAAGTVLVINAWNHSSTALDRIVSGLAHVLENTAYTLHRFNSQPRPHTRLHVLPTRAYLESHDVVGAILWAQNPIDTEALVELRNTVPLILVDRRVIGMEADCIGFDDEAGGYAVTKHLITQGHRRIGFLGDETFAETVQQRWHGFARAQEEAHIAPDPTPFALFEGIREPMFSDYMRVFLAGAGEPLTAVVCSNDLTALTLLRFLRREGIRVPDEIAVTGYGNLLPSYLDTLELTTVNQPFEDVGRGAGALLRERLAQSADDKANYTRRFRHVQLPVELIVRNSSGTAKLGIANDKEGVLSK